MCINLKLLVHSFMLINPSIIICGENFVIQNSVFDIHYLKVNEKMQVLKIRNDADIQ